MPLDSSVIAAAARAGFRIVDMEWLCDVPQSTIRRCASRARITLPGRKCRTPDKAEMTALLAEHGTVSGVAKALGLRTDYVRRVLEQHDLVAPLESRIG